MLASIPLVARILFPRLDRADPPATFGRFVQAPAADPAAARADRADPRARGGPASGSRVDEMTDIGERLLRDIGLTSGFARLVLLLGHGSNSLNNPHNRPTTAAPAAGAAGGPNARALAQILNDPRVRRGPGAARA